MKNYSMWIDLAVLAPFALICTLMWIRATRKPEYIVPPYVPHQPPPRVALPPDLAVASADAFEEFLIDEHATVEASQASRADLRFAYRMGFVDGVDFGSVKAYRTSREMAQEMAQEVFGG